MAVVQQSIVGISSNPDPRPIDGPTTLTTPANWSDPNRANITYSVAGRTARVVVRNPNFYSKAGGTSAGTA